MYEGDAVLKAKDATITKSGILCNGCYYSCEVALREQWFAGGVKPEATKLTAFIDNQTHEYIFVKLRTGDLSIAFKVDGAVHVAAQFPCRESSGFFLPVLTVMRDNEWRVQPKAVPPFIVQGAAKATK